MENNNTRTTMEPEKTNVFLGIIGAILGALIGAAIWTGLNQIGIIASIAGIAIIYLSYRGYNLLGKGRDSKAKIVAVIISIIVLIMTHFFCWGLDIYNEFSPEYEMTLIDAIMLVPDFALEPELIVGFFRDLLIGFITLGIGYFSYIRRDIEELEAQEEQEQEEQE